jgi:putative transposase
LDLITKKNIINKEEVISIKEQCDILDFSRSSYYYESTRFITDEEKAMMKLIEELFEECPWYGHRMIYQELKDSDIPIGRDRTLKYMKILGLDPIYPKKKTTIPNKEHKKYPYLLKNLDIVRPNQVWATDITYIKLPKGYCYFVGIIDWYSRRILSYRISNSLDTQFCIDALNEAIEIYGPPEIFNSDQGCQFTSEAFTDILKKKHIKISMDSVGRWADNIIIERFFRTLKYQNIYIFNYETIRQVKKGVASYIEYYNFRRKHSSLGYSTPDEFYNQTFLRLAA